MRSETPTVWMRSGRRWRSRIDAPPTACASDASRPTRTLEDQLAAIWRDVLGVWPIHPEDDFFEVGGTSLLTVPLFQAIHDRLGRSLPLSTIISAPTVASMASILREQTDDQWSPLVLLKPGAREMPLFLAPGLRGEVLGLRPLARALATDRPVYGLRTQALVAGDQPHGSPSKRSTAARTRRDA